MADSFEDLGTFPIFGYDNYFNWKTSLPSNFNYSRKIMNYPGTIDNLIDISDNQPINFDLEIINKSKQEEYNLLTALNSYKGNYENFWAMFPIDLFELGLAYNSNDDIISIKDNGFVYRGFERLYIKLNNDDSITRKVTSYNLLENGIIELGIGQIDQSFTADDIEFFSLFLLCRFDQNEFEFTFYSKNVSSCPLKLKELVLEYP